MTEIEHFGVKGMHWGVRKEVSPAQALGKAQKKMAKIDADKALEGAGYQGFAANKIYSRAIKKNPNFNYDKLSVAEKARYDKKINARAIGSVLNAGIFETAVILGGGNIILNHVTAKPQTKAGARFAVALLAAKVGAVRIHQLRAIHENNKLNRLRDQINALGGGPKD